MLNSFHVFPCANKAPLTEHGFYDASNDQGQIEEWKRTLSPKQWAVRTGHASGVWVLDLDKKEDVDGQDWLNEQELKHEPIPDTYSVLTPSGGVHYYFKYPPDKHIKCSHGKIAPAVDIKAEDGYVIHQGVGYEVEQDYPIADAPEWLVSLAYDAAYVDPSQFTDPETGKVLPGYRNDYLTHKAGKLKRPDFSTDAIYAALIVENDEKCDPPLHSKEVRSIAVSIGKKPASDPVEIPTGIKRADTDTLFTEPPPMRYLFDGLVPLGIVSGVNAEGGTGKSMLTQTLVTSVVTGRTLLPSFVPAEPAPVIWFAGEDPFDEVHRRHARIAAHYEVTDKEAFKKNLFLFNDAQPMGKDESGKFTLDLFGHMIKKQIAEVRPRLVVLDPRAIFQGFEENNNTLTAQFFRILQSWAAEFECTIWLSHHTAKGTANHASSDSGRGATAARDAMRCVFHLQTPTEAMVPEGEVPTRFAVLNMVKANFTPRTPTDIWFERHEGGVLVERDIAERKQDAEQFNRGKLVSRIMDLVGTDNKLSLTRRDIRAKHELLKCKFGEVYPAIDYGVESGYLSNVKRGRKVCPVARSARGDLDLVE